MTSLYIHFPYCLYKCHYCDFNSYKIVADQVPTSQYRAALISEMQQRQQLFEKIGHHFLKPAKLDSIFFGGGTPSLMRAEDVKIILNEVSNYFQITPDTEITLEANPKTLNPEKLKTFRQAGINRISMGVQSLHDSYLGNFGRIHSADDAREAIGWISKTGFTSWNVDLIYGFPGQTIKEWEKDLQEVLQYAPPHFSCYSLTVEKGTRFAHDVAEGHQEAPSDDKQAEMAEVTSSFLSEAGYDHYEVSNFCKPGHESRHNLNYWRYGSYIGLGAGAVSAFPGYRTNNEKLPQKYIQSFSSSQKWFDVEEISPATAMGEFMMMGLRLKQGVDSQNFEKLFGIKMENYFQPAFAELREKGWLEKNRLALTHSGHLFSNQAVSAFLSSSLPDREMS